MKPESKKGVAYTKQNDSCFDLKDLSQALDMEERTLITSNTSSSSSSSNNNHRSAVYDFSEVSKALSAESTVEDNDDDDDDDDKTVVGELLRSQRLLYPLRLKLEMKEKKASIRMGRMLSVARLNHGKIKFLTDRKRNKRWRQLKLTDIFSLDNLTLKDESSNLTPD